MFTAWKPPPFAVTLTNTGANVTRGETSIEFDSQFVVPATGPLIEPVTVTSRSLVTICVAGFWPKFANAVPAALTLRKFKPVRMTSGAVRTAAGFNDVVASVAVMLAVLPAVHGPSTRR